MPFVILESFWLLALYSLEINWCPSPCQLVILKLDAQYTKDALRQQLQKPHEEFCGRSKGRSWFSGEEAFPASCPLFQHAQPCAATCSLLHSHYMSYFLQQVQARTLLRRNLWAGQSDCWVFGFFKLSKKLEVILQGQTKQVEAL